ncbi:restriction endonuclease [Vagococcus penaei]|uniref:Restriction endonuclease n=1 Tax=Vagococcus penaei TaxID=633807 RepID=A0A1Q2D8V7_9ENTE|nr:NgoBV family restriction endonuclease [Vagococcus penaei]AQP54633.1 restriction endonuclease [Vagococcus penaei]RST98340.1 restriction endonuclease [Vagococcus penaei]
MKNLDELYELALKDIKGQIGTITITIGGTPKISSTNDIIGNCVQEWIPQWLEDNGLDLTVNKQTQVFPDFIAKIDGKEYNMEVKCFNLNNGPGFDLANFGGFYDSIYKDPTKLNAKYLVFAYRPTTHGFRIEEVYMKNLWELTKRTPKYPVSLQVKREQPYAIRPSNFHTRPNEMFSTRREFLEAIKEVREMFPFDGSVDPDMWFSEIERNFQKLTGEEL